MTFRFHVVEIKNVDQWEQKSDIESILVDHNMTYLLSNIIFICPTSTLCPDSVTNGGPYMEDDDIDMLIEFVSPHETSLEKLGKIGVMEEVVLEGHNSARDSILQLI